MLPATRLDLSGRRIIAKYALAGSEHDARRTADHLRVEQTIEFPADLLPADDIQRHIVASLEDLRPAGEDRWLATMSFAEEVSAFEGPQLLNMLFGNISLVPGVRLVDVELPKSSSTWLPGPRHGLPGVRTLVKAPRRALLATALKPMGTPLAELAAMTTDFVAAGIDLIKDDHGLANQPFGLFKDRVRCISQAVQTANATHDRHCVYLPSMNVPLDQFMDSAATAIDAGAGGFLVMAGLHGFDALRTLATNDNFDAIIMAHPSLLGSFVADPNSGIDHSLIFGKLPRLFGADISVFPSYGGRFSFSQDDCSRISEALVQPSHLRASLPAPAGGISVENANQILSTYGNDVCLLVGGSLHRGDRRQRAEQLREVVENFAG